MDRKLVTKILIALISFIALAVIIYLYSTAFKYKNENKSLSLALSSYSKADVEVLATKNNGWDLFVFFKKADSAHEFGFGCFKKGILGNYRYLSSTKIATPYDAAVTISPYSMSGYSGDRKLLLIGGYHCASIAQFGIKIWDWSSGETLDIVKFPVENDEFFMIIPQTDLVNTPRVTADDAPYPWGIARLYDENGSDITESLQSAADESWNGSTAVAERFTLYAGMILVAVIAGAFITGLLKNIKKSPGGHEMRP